MPVTRIRSLLARQRLTVLGGLFVVAGSTVAYGDSGFPFLSTGFAALLGLAAFAAFILAVPLAFRPAGRAAVFAIGLTFFLDVAYFGGGPVAGAAIVLLAGYLTYVIAWRGNHTLAPFATTAVVVSTILILPQQVLTNARLAPAALELSKNGAVSGRRAYVHIILDEMSPLAMMPSGPFYNALRKRMAEDYRRRGFDLIPNTLASAGATIVSLGQVLARHNDEMHNYNLTDSAFTYSMGQNRVAEKLASAGYGVTILQSSYLEICHPDRWHCLTYSVSGDGAALSERVTDGDSAIGYAVRTTGLRLLISDTVRSSVYYQAFAEITKYFGFVPPSWTRDFARPPLTVSLMEKAVPMLRHLRTGEAVFLHLLLPHYPYLLDEQCRVRSPDEVFAPLWVSRNIGVEFDAAAAERAYWQQAACTHDKLMAMIDAVLASPAGKEAIVLVHGDHGSRLFEKFIDESASESERRHALLAHFAVRGLEDRHGELLAHHQLRERVSIVLNGVLEGRRDDHVLTTSATR